MTKYPNNKQTNIKIVKIQNMLFLIPFGEHNIINIAYLEEFSKIGSMIKHESRH